MCACLFVLFFFGYTRQSQAENTSAWAFSQSTTMKTDTSLASNGATVHSTHTVWPHTHTHRQMKRTRANDTWERDPLMQQVRLAPFGVTLTSNKIPFKDNEDEKRDRRHSSPVYSSRGVKCFGEKEAPNDSRSGVTARTQHKGRFPRRYSELKMRKISRKF